MQEQLTATQTAALIRRRELGCVEAIELAHAAIEADEERILAFAAREPELALARARELDRLPPELAAGMPLRGVPLAVKDVFDTAQLPTEYGSPIYAGHRPAADAALVTLATAAGAVIVGKTRTCEFAFVHPTQTRNPLDPTRTPGGSSSGSAAAVAAGMVPLALGTQTAGSLVRPGSYCGILALKPTFALLPLAGALPTSASLDTAGIFARAVGDLELALDALARAPAGTASARPSRPLCAAGTSEGAPRLGLLSNGLEQLEQPARRAIEDYLARAAASGAVIEELAADAGGERLYAAQLTIQRVETAAALGAEVDRHGEAVSAELREFVALGRASAPDAYLDALRVADEERSRWPARVAGFDAVLAASTLGAPPLLSEGTTGDPLLCRPFTLLGVPALALPGAWTAAGLPAGMQLAGALGGERRVLGAARWLLERLGGGLPDPAGE